MEPPEIGPALSTPASRTFEQDGQVAKCPQPTLSADRLYFKYEVGKTLSEIRAARFKRIALQFPDGMLADAPRVSNLLAAGLQKPPDLTSELSNLDVCFADSAINLEDENAVESYAAPRLYILGDTSYAACCVDEVAAEHVDADAVIHYGRACLSPTARLPAIHVFTRQPLEDRRPILEIASQLFPDKREKVIIMADVTYQYCLPDVRTDLMNAGYVYLHEAQVVHDSASLLPNRTVPDEVREDPSKLKDWHVFHISEPPESLLLTLSARVASVGIYPTEPSSRVTGTLPHLCASRLLSRRYGLLTSVSSVSIFGILINTLSVKNYLQAAGHVKQMILAAGKKSYTFVVGKLNAAKLANFSEIGAWVVIGCWESSLIDSKDFWKPVITPFELEMALKPDDERVWTGDWSGDCQTMASALKNDRMGRENLEDVNEGRDGKQDDIVDGEAIDSEPETAPPEFDLRTGKLISHSKPMHRAIPRAAENIGGSSALLKRAKGELISMGGEPSPGAEYLRTKRTWRGLGSDQEMAYEEAGTAIEEGRSGIARGYTHREAEAKV